MDQKDKIILQQLDVIRSMTENGMKRMNSDFWGAPAAPQAPAAPKAPTPEAGGKKSRRFHRPEGGGAQGGAAAAGKNGGSAEGAGQLHRP